MLACHMRTRRLSLHIRIKSRLNSDWSRYKGDVQVYPETIHLLAEL